MTDYVLQSLSDYALQFGFALVVLTVASAVIIISRRNYVRSADFKRGIETLRLEFRHSINAAQTATTKRATTISENLVSALEPIDSTVRDLNFRLARLEEYADATAGSQQQAFDENERIAARLAGLEQNLRALTNQVSSIKQTIDGAIVREKDRDNSIEAINSRLINTQKQVDELFSRLELGEEARKDLGSLISLFVKQLKRVNANSAETALRVADLESHFRSKARELEERLSSPSTGKIEDVVEDATPKAGDEALPIETNTDTENASVFERSPTPTEETSNEASVDGGSHSDNGRADLEP